MGGTSSKKKDETAQPATAPKESYQYNYRGVQTAPYRASSFAQLNLSNSYSTRPTTATGSVRTPTTTSARASTTSTTNATAPSTVTRPSTTGQLHHQRNQQQHKTTATARPAITATTSSNVNTSNASTTVNSARPTVLPTFSYALLSVLPTRPTATVAPTSAYQCNAIVHTPILTTSTNRNAKVVAPTTSTKTALSSTTSAPTATVAPTPAHTSDGIMHSTPPASTPSSHKSNVPRGGSSGNAATTSPSQPDLKTITSSAQPDLLHAVERELSRMALIIREKKQVEDKQGDLTVPRALSGNPPTIADTPPAQDTQLPTSSKPVLPIRRLYVDSSHPLSKLCSINQPDRSIHRYDYKDAYSATENDSNIPVYMMSVTQGRMCLFEPSREKFVEAPNITRGVCKQGEVCVISSVREGQVFGLATASQVRRNQYLARGSYAFGSEYSYRELILPALILGSRVRDFEQRCAVVEQIDEQIVITMPPQNGRIKELTLKTIEGNKFSVKVKFVKRAKDGEVEKKWTVTCHPPKASLPVEVVKGSQLEIMDTNINQPRVTAALMRTHVRDKEEPIENWDLLSRIYGRPGSGNHPLPLRSSTHISYANNKGTVTLNPEQQEAVSRYNSDSCPGFVIEAPPGSGKTMTAAAMALSYKGDGVQLFLSTANVPVINMALALAKLDIGYLKAIHFISSEREEQMTEETRSPFSVLSLAKKNEERNRVIRSLEWAMKHAPNDEEHERLKNEIRKTCKPVYDDNFDVYFATVDMILGRLFKNNQGGRHEVDSIKKQLMTNVRRIVLDEASQLTEAALNALILCFPQAQIVLIGDSKQLPPFKYTQGDVVSELSARSALEICKAKGNLPVTRLIRVYRASPTLIAHYSEVFYEGWLVSRKPDSPDNPLSCFGARSGGSRCLFWKVKGRQQQEGTSKVNEAEIKTLNYIINILRNSGFDSKSVMIISYYEAQRKKAEEMLPGGYEVLTVDSAQGREKSIVIVLTTRTSVPADDTGSFFTCPLRCNVAMSRHQEALIVLGNNSILFAPNWNRILSTNYFKHVESFSVNGENKRSRK